MKNTWIIFLFTLKNTINRKKFIVPTIVMVAIVMIVSLFPYISEWSEQTQNQKKAAAQTEGENVTQDTSSVKKNVSGYCYYIDDDGLIPNGLTALQNNLDTIGVVKGSGDQLEFYKHMVAGDRTRSLIYVTAPEKDSKVQLPTVHILTRDILTGVNESDVKDILSRAYISSLLTQQGLTSDITDLLQLELPTEATNTANMQLTGYLLALAVVLVSFFAVYFYGYSISVSLANEKSSRIMEMLAVSARPRQILMGKLMAMVVMAVLQFLIVMVVCMLGFYYLVPSGYTILGLELRLTSFVTWKQALAAVVFFTLGIMFYSTLNIIAGSMVSRVEDLSGAMMPVILIAIVMAIASSLIALENQSVGRAVRIAASLLPLTSPFYMPYRILGGSISARETLISAVVLLISVGFLLSLSAKVSRATMLHYGRRLRMRDVIKAKQ